MDLKPGDVVIPKSGGHPLTVAEVNEDAVECIWMGDEGDLFRETLPLAVLEVAELDVVEEDAEAHEHDDDEHEDDEDEDEEDEDEDKPRGKKSKVA
jgi:uncharacterized protein YodC (DUF2158 family)